MSLSTKRNQKRWGRTLHTHQRKNPTNDISILNINTLNAKAPTFVQETLLKLKSHIEHHTIVVGDFNTPLSLIDRSAKQTKQRNNKINML